MTKPATTDPEQLKGFERLNLSGRLAVVTGAAGGIGAATCRLLRARGARVIGIDVLPSEDGSWISADLGSSRECARTAELIAYKEDAIDILVNNAGVGAFGLGIEDATEDDWDRVNNINVKATFMLTKALLPQLKNAAASIVNVSSVHAVATGSGVAPYAASKGALLALTRSMAVDLAQYRIRVTSVLPGATESPMFRSHVDKVGKGVEGIGLSFDETAFPRVCQPDETAEVIAFLASPAGSAVSGSTVYADGGMLSTLGF